MSFWSRLLLAIVVCLSTTQVSSQSIFYSEEKIQAELDSRGLDMEEVEEALKERGVDLDYITQANITPQQITVIQEVILELEQNKIVENQILLIQDTTDLEEVPLDSIDLEELTEEELALLESEEDEMEEVTIYGQQLFRKNILELQSSSEEIKAPDSYVLGPGDDIVISVWGRSQFDNEFRISEKGYIKVLNGQKRVYLKGLNLGKAKSKLYNVFNEYYSFNEGEFDVSLNFSRTVKVSVYGEVYENPGSFAIPAFNSAFNALSAVKGTNDIGSLRKIQLQKASGETKTMDIYAFMRNPSISTDFYLEDNDIILVPVAEKIVSIEGAIRRPMKYELVDKEGIRELLSFSGGFADNAFQKKIQIHRFVDDQSTIIDIDWRDYEAKNKNFELLHGDVVRVEVIDKEARNFVEVLGEVAQPGVFERSSNMKVYDLIRKAGLTELSKIDLIYLTRTNFDGSTEYVKLDLEAIMKMPSSPDNLLLQDKDKLEVWALDRFTDEVEIAIDGAVRLPGKFPYDRSAMIRVRDAITLAGGLRRDASNYAVIHRNDPLDPKVKYYKTIDNLDAIFESENVETNYILSPFDSLVVKSKNTFLEESFVRIEGAVNNPGEFQYGQGMNIKDLMTMAGGFKLAASTNNIEISRVIIKNNEPTRTIVANLEMDRNFNVVNKSEATYTLEPFDNIAVRYIKEFQLQKRVFLEGEVLYPGPYAISKENERILSILERAGGLTDEAFPSGATLIRDDQDYGSVVIKLEEIIKNPDSQFNFLVKNGDRISVPKIKEFVTIKGATRAKEAVGLGKINEGNAIHVPFHKGKDAMFYINEYAGGLHDNADKQKIFVEHANGEIKRPRSGFLIKKFPKVYRGSVITVGYKSLEKNNEEIKENVDWTKVLGDSVAQAMSILTLILLIGRID